MHAATHRVRLELESLLREELPYVYGLSSNHANLRQSVRELLSFPLQHVAAMPFYQVPEKCVEPIADAFSAAYAALLNGLERLFDDPQAMRTFMDCPFLRRHGERFVPYARHTFRSRTLTGQSLYGRFDAALNPASGQVTGIYEFNGDTPVMLFESINLQHRLSSQIDPSGQRQFNEWYGMTGDLLRAHRFEPHHQIALACSFDHIEDLATCETLAQVVGEQAAAHLLDLTDIDYDHANPEQPFVIHGTDTYLDALFVLSPWEEMVENFPQAFMQWERWADRVAVLEPAWKWFISHKGMLAYLTWLLENDADFARRHANAPLLRTYLDPEPLRNTGTPYVAKPVLGRLSANIEIYDADGQCTSRNNGEYGDCPRIYQEYHPPFHLEGRGNFIACMWMAGQPLTRMALPATLCFREFDTAVLELSNERFVPHVLVPIDGGRT